MTLRKRAVWPLLTCAALVVPVACGNDDEPEGATSGMQQPQSLCEKYGGPDSVAMVVQGVVAEIAGDCRVNTFFTSLTADELGHVGECLTTQVQELFGCEGVTYAGSEDSKGVACRDMKTAHMGMGVSNFNHKGSPDMNPTIVEVDLAKTVFQLAVIPIGV